MVVTVKFSKIDDDDKAAKEAERVRIISQKALELAFSSGSIEEVVAFLTDKSGANLPYVKTEPANQSHHSIPKEVEYSYGRFGSLVHLVALDVCDAVSYALTNTNHANPVSSAAQRFNRALFYSRFIDFDIAPFAIGYMRKFPVGSLQGTLVDYVADIGRLSEPALMDAYIDGLRSPPHVWDLVEFRDKYGFRDSERGKYDLTGKISPRKTPVARPSLAHPGFRIAELVSAAGNFIVPALDDEALMQTEKALGYDPVSFMQQKYNSVLQASVDAQVHILSNRITRYSTAELAGYIDKARHLLKNPPF